MKRKKGVKKTKSLVPSGFESFGEREIKYREITKHLQEAYPMVGGGSDDALWRNLTTITNRDLNLTTQKRMQDIAFYMYDSNPMGKRIIELVKDFVVGDGFTFIAKDDSVKEVIRAFWDDPQNNLDDEIEIFVKEQSIFGELFLPVWVNEVDGSVKLGYIDPTLVQGVKKDRNNPRINKKVIWRRVGSQESKTMDIINVDKRVTSKTNGKLVGGGFFFPINKVISASRGRSDLLTLSDWLDGYDQFLFARLERAFLLNNFIWDIQCDGMTEAELKVFVKNLAIPKPGSIRAHNEKIKWKAETPKLESDDASNEARLFKNQILGGAGFPEHWFAEGSTTTRATALEMGLPTLKKLKSRQKTVKSMLVQMIKFVIDQAIIAGTLKENVDKTFRIIGSPIVSRDNKTVADSINGFVEGLGKAEEKLYIDKTQAKVIFNLFISQVGVDLEKDYEMDLEANPKKKEVVKDKGGENEVK